MNLVTRRWGAEGRSRQESGAEGDSGSRVQGRRGRLVGIAFGAGSLHPGSQRWKLAGEEWWEELEMGEGAPCVERLECRRRCFGLEPDSVPAPLLRWRGALHSFFYYGDNYSLRDFNPFAKIS